MIGAQLMFPVHWLTVVIGSVLTGHLLIVLCGWLALVVMPTSVASAFSCLCVACWFELLFLDPTLCMPQGVLRLAVPNV